MPALSTGSGARPPPPQQQQQPRGYHQAPQDGLADAWAAADGRLPERPDTAESQFYDNRAKAMGGRTPWADQESSRPDQPPVAGHRPTTPWAPDDSMTAANAAAVGAYGRQEKVNTPWALQQSMEGFSAPNTAAAPDDYRSRARPSSAASSCFF